MRALTGGGIWIPDRVDQKCRMKKHLFKHALTHDTQANNCCLDSHHSFLLNATSVTAIFVKDNGFLVSIMVDRVRHLLSSPATLRKVNIISGILLILVGVIIPLT